MFTKERNVHDTVASFKEAIDWIRNQIGPRNADCLKERIQHLYSKAVLHGIRLAADVAASYDKYSYHPYLVSDCILGKLNAMEGKVRKNPAAKKINDALTILEHKVDSAEATTRLMARSAQISKANKNRKGG